MIFISGRMLLLVLFASLSLGVANGQTQPVAPTNSSVLPWNRDESTLGALPARPPTSARELLINVDESEWNHFVDGQPLNAGDDETLNRILYRLPAIQLDNVEQLTRGDVAWQQLAEDPKRYRAEFFKLSGRVTDMTRVELIPEVAVRLDFDHYFRVAIELDGAPYPVLVCSRKVPQAWLTSQPLQERVSAYGLFIKVGDASGSHPQLVFAAQRVAWHPDRVAPPLSIDAEHVLLGDLGFDVGLFDDVRKTNFREVTSADRECFYQLLAAVGRADSAKLLASAQDEFSLIELLRDPQPHQGQLASVNGVARRVTKILVDDADVQQRFHIDHYYQIDMFILLGDQVIRMDSAGSKKEGPQYSRMYPVTVCAVRLPPGLPEGMNLRQEVRMPAFFFKLWSYKSEYVTAVDKSSSQRSPMFFALEPVVVPQEPTSNPAANIAIAVLAITAAIIWFGYLRQARRNAKSRREGKAQRLTIDPEKSLNDLDIHLHDK